jgi:5'-phosphate synthase pdxT subunit
MRVGVLALQGAFVEHENALRRLGVEVVEVRLPEHMEGLEGLIIPGGESTTIGRLAQKYGLLDPIRALGAAGKSLWGTCAGMILMAKEVADAVPGQPLLELMDIRVRRNAFGRQVNSFETDLEVPALGKPSFHAVFIRAPIVERVGKRVEVLAQLEDGRAVAVQQGNLLATTFHPELADDDRFHRYFVSLSLC